MTPMSVKISSVICAKHFRFCVNPIFVIGFASFEKYIKRLLGMYKLFAQFLAFYHLHVCVD